MYLSPSTPCTYILMVEELKLKRLVDIIICEFHVIFIFYMKKHTGNVMNSSDGLFFFSGLVWFSRFFSLGVVYYMVECLFKVIL